MYCWFKRATLFCAAIWLLIGSAVGAELVVFGDSLSDTGNFSLASQGQLPPTPLYADGRFSNGQVWVEYVAQYLRMPQPTPSLLGGSNYAFNGARAAGLSPYGSPDLNLQIQDFLGRNQGVASPDDLYVIWAGANDIFFGAAANELSFIPDALAAVAQAVGRLRSAGARYILVLNLPPLGDTPYFNRQLAAAEQLNLASELFNEGLRATLTQLRLAYTDIVVIEVDVHQQFGLIQSRPRAFRLVNIREASTVFDPTGTGLGMALDPQATPDRYLFWDGIHPTTRGHEIIARFSTLAILRAYLGKP
ncbi:MAG: SGNH/GDSL hydrolase family protein [bacterium]|nr:SGNH/GDSL hydrolase family protein [bacterium]